MYDPIGEGKTTLTLASIEAFLTQFFTPEFLQAHALHDALVIIEEQELSSVLNFLNTLTLPKGYENIEELLCERLSKLLECGPNDMVLYAENTLYIKHYFTIETAQNGDRRACGLSAEVLESYKQRYFPDHAYQEDVMGLFPFVVHNYLNFKTINPSKFKKVFIPTLVNTVEIVVIAHANIDDERTIRGLTFYLLREMFDALMLFIAEDILYHFSNGDKKAIEFLSCFSINDTIDAQGVRHKANPILDESNHAWNLTTIRTTMMQYKKAKQTLYDKKNALLSIKKKLDTYTKEVKEFTAKMASASRMLEESNEKMLNLRRTIDKLEESDAPDVRFSEGGEEKIFPRRVLISKLFKHEDLLMSEKSTLRRSMDELELRLSNKQKEIDTWEKKFVETKEFIATIEAHGHPIDKQYERLRRALAKTLASR